jgi:DNA-binding response OmpR family regulator
MEDMHRYESPLSVLVVEDMEDTADTLAEYLRQGYGYDVRVANDGATGLKWTQVDPPDIVITDAPDISRCCALWGLSSNSTRI